MWPRMTGRTFAFFFLSFLTLSLLHVCIHSCAGTHLCVCLRTRGQPQVLFLRSHLPCFLRQNSPTGSWGFPITLECWSNSLGDPPVSISSELGFINAHYHDQLFIWVVGIDSGPQACHFPMYTISLAPGKILSIAHQELKACNITIE